jgi:hypothetical protein
MWTQITRYLPEFDTAVLGGFGQDGRPFSLRGRVLIADTNLLRLLIPADTPLVCGPACLTCHRHDERLWNLKSFAVRGMLERDEKGWLMHPEQFIPGAGIGGVLSYVRFLRDGRRTTKRYLQKRGLARPQVPWDEWSDMFKQALASGASG